MHDKVECAYSTIDGDEVIKNNLKISHDISVTNVPNLNNSSEKLLDTNMSKIHNVTNNIVLNYNDSSLTDVDISLILITKKVRTNIEYAKVEFDTFLCRDEATKNNKEINTSKQSLKFFQKYQKIK